MRPRVRNQQPGREAKHPGWCPLCPDPIQVGDRIVFRKHRAIHVRCAAGADDG